MQFYSRYAPPPSPSVSFDESPSLTVQAFKQECDINRILAKFRETGSLVDPLHPPTRKPIFGDFTDIPDYQGMLDLIHAADDAFAALPAKVRDRFANNPQEIFDFLSDEKNRDEAIALGLISVPDKPQDKPPSDVSKTENPE